MPLVFAQNSLQMEWCLNCHRNPAKNLRPTSEVYNMAWEQPSPDRPVWCAVGEEKDGVPTAQSVNCVSTEPEAAVKSAALAQREVLMNAAADSSSGVADMELVSLNSGEATDSAPFHKFTSQDALGQFLVHSYKIRTPKELSSCEVCHR
jgi:hypothetical protein